MSHPLELKDQLARPTDDANCVGGREKMLETELGNLAAADSIALMVKVGSGFSVGSSGSAKVPQGFWSQEHPHKPLAITGEEELCWN